MRFFDIGRRTAPLPRLRRGATLLELLTVIVVLMMITSVTIPVVAPHAEGRRIREGARMFSTFINAGRTRAIETGRPAGVWIERMSNLPEAANMAFFAEIPPVYCGDFLDSTVECCVVGKQTGATTWPNQSDQEYYNIVIPRNRSAYNTDVWSEPSADEDQSVGSHQLVRERDLIKFEGIDRYYSLHVIDDYGVPGSDRKKWWYVAKGINAGSGSATSYSGDVDNRLRYVINWFNGPYGKHMGWSSIVRTTTAPMTYADPGLRYQIYRQPARLQAGSIRMPEGVVIDLNFSSVTDGTEGSDGIPFHPRKGANLFLGDAFYPQDNTPIVLVFSPDGRVQRLYCHVKDTGNHWSWDSTEPYGSAFFLIGERRSIVPHETSNVYEQQIKKNWLNSNALWVRVNCQTGFTNTAQLEILEDGGGVTAAKKAENPGTYLNETRIKARAARTVGGR